MYRHPCIPFVIHSSRNLQSFHCSGLTLLCALLPSVLRCWVFLWALGMAHREQNLHFAPCHEGCGASGIVAPPASGVQAAGRPREPPTCAPGPCFPFSCPAPRAAGRPRGDRCRQTQPLPRGDLCCHPGWRETSPESIRAPRHPHGLLKPARGFQPATQTTAKSGSASPKDG